MRDFISETSTRVPLLTGHVSFPKCKGVRTSFAVLLVIVSIGVVEASVRWCLQARGGPGGAARLLPWRRPVAHQHPHVRLPRESTEDKLSRATSFQDEGLGVT